MFAQIPRIKTKCPVAHITTNTNGTHAKNPIREYYREEFGDESWELDALDPTTLSALIAAEMEEIINKKKWKESESLRDEGRTDLSAISEHWDRIKDFARELAE